MKELKKAGLKVTMPRVTILELLQNSLDPDHHYSAEEIFSALREKEHDIGLATVYRVLSQFEQAGILVKHHFEGSQAVFELETGDHHNHIVCLKCNKTVEFIDDKLKEYHRQIAERYGYVLEERGITLHGICENCGVK